MAQVVLRALGAPNALEVIHDSKLPAYAVRVKSADTIVAVTADPAPAFRNDILKVASRQHCHVILIRYDDAIAATADVIFDTGSLLRSFTNLEFFRSQGGGLWLLAPGFPGPHIALTPRGLRLEAPGPYDELAERQAGVGRAADEIVEHCRLDV